MIGGTILCNAQLPILQCNNYLLYNWYPSYGSRNNAQKSFEPYAIENSVKKSEKKSKFDKEKDENFPILIKKYPNRRLYNTATSSYITLDDVVELVRRDTEFIVEDTKTGEDITRYILNQIIYEREIKPDNFHFPLAFQKQLINMYGDTFGQLIPDYLTESLNLLDKERSKLSQSLENILDCNTRAMLDYSHNLARRNMEMFRKSWEMFSMVSSSKQSGEEDNQRDEATEIQRKIDQLQKRLEELRT